MEALTQQGWGKQWTVFPASSNAQAEYLTRVKRFPSKMRSQKGDVC